METKPALPVERAFVVQFRDAADLGPRGFEGRVEHVRSGQAMGFHSLQELVDFFDRVLTKEGRP